MKIKQLINSSIIPTRGTEESIGYDVYNDLQQTITIPPNDIAIIPTGIAITLPTGCYAKIAPQSSLTIKQKLTTLAGVIDPDYCGEIKIVLHNYGKEPQLIEPSTRIAQMIMEQAATPKVEIVDEISKTERDNKGFGSTTSSIPAINNLTVQQVTYTPAHNIYLISDPFEHITSRSITSNKIDDNLLGMELEQCQLQNLPKLINCSRGSSSIRIPL